MKWPLLTLRIEREDDVVAARQRARAIAERLGFTLQDQTRLATAVSEIARNAFAYAAGGQVQFGVDDGDDGQSFTTCVADEGPGIANLALILSGEYRSSTGLGLGILGARRLVDRFDVRSSEGKGTAVTLMKRLPAGRVVTAGPGLTALVEGVARSRAEDPHVALREQNRDLLRSLAELAERDDEAQRLNRELTETNRGVVALYAELEAQAAQLRDAGANLERQVAARTAELAEANERLRAEAAERGRMEADLRQSQKMEAVGQLTGGIAHDFNNLLTGIVGSLDLMRGRIAKGQPQNLSRYLDAAMQSANRAAALTHRLLAFARRQPLDPKATDVNVLLGGITDLLRRTIHEAIELRIETADDLWLTLCDPHQLENAVLNLAINARDAMPNGGVLTIETCNLPAGMDGDVSGSERRGGDFIRVRVEDTGTGMAPDVIARAFDPFFTTKPTGQGTGLGLSMIYGFAQQSKGHARIESKVGLGTSVALYLPRYAGPREAGSSVQTPAEAGVGAGETVLVVEDEAVVRDMIVEVLTETGYRTLHAEDGIRGLEVLSAAEHVDLLITDVGLPGLNGRQMADQARLVRPDLPVLLMTGYAENMAGAAEVLEQGMSIMTKPFTMDVVVERVRRLLGKGTDG